MRAQIDTDMAAEGYTKITVAEWNAKAHGSAIFWRWHAQEGVEPGYRRVEITGSSRPSWSSHFSLYAPGGARVDIAKADEPIYIKPPIRVAGDTREYV